MKKLFGILNNWFTQKHKLVLEIFIISNYGFLILDITLAHGSNHFASSGEWIPLGFSIFASLLLFVFLFVSPNRIFKSAKCIIAWGSILMGMMGVLYHLEHGFFQEQTLKNLVYTAPFLAPLAYTGLGFLLLLNLTDSVEANDWGRWVIFMALGGFVGNFGLSLCDHAQNGFFKTTEWLPVISSAFAIGFLVTAIFEKQWSRDFIYLIIAILGIQVLVGTIGFYFHLKGILERFGSNWIDNFIYGAPPFAPLLFINLALLAFIGTIQQKTMPHKIKRF